MSYGLETYNSNGSKMIYSPNNEHYFYRGSQSVSTAQLTLTATNAFSLSSIYATDETCVANFGTTYGGSGVGSFKAPGLIDINNVYHPPSPTKTFTEDTSNIYNVNTGLPATAMIGTAHKVSRKAYTAGEYSLFAATSTNYTVIDKDEVPLYYQPASGGALIRSAFASSIPFGASNELPINYTFPAISANVIFPMAYSYPPLIFITNSGGQHLALYSYTKNSSGKYTGATIVCGRGSRTAVTTTMRNQSVTVYLYKDTVSCTFQYYIMSPEIPTYYTTSVGNYGIHVFNGSGSLIFDSRYSSTGLNRQYIYTPHFNLSRSTSYSETHESATVNHNSICVNSFHPLVGYATMSNAAIIEGSVKYFAMAFDFLGRYVKVNGDGTGLVRSYPTISKHWYSVGGSSQNAYMAFDYNIGGAETMAVLVNDYSDYILP